SLETIKLRAMLHIQKFVDEGVEGGDNQASPWKPVGSGGAGGGESPYRQISSRMNDGSFDDETPF
ncbi:MAG: replicative DNA helicase, partial [Flavihumibacter sp.]